MKLFKILLYLKVYYVVAHSYEEALDAVKKVENYEHIYSIELISNEVIIANETENRN